MRRRRLALGGTLAAVLLAGATGIGPAGATGGPIVAKGGLDFKANRYIRSDQRFSPDKRTVAPGDVLTLRNQDEVGEPHTWTVMDFGPDFPKSAVGAFTCGFCNDIAGAHFPDAGPPVAQLDEGAPGFDTQGDSVLLFDGESAQVDVSAPAGTNLFLLCALHPWMQMRVNVR